MVIRMSFPFGHSVSCIKEETTSSLGGMAAILEALHKADLIVGATPADGAHASLKDIRPFHKYMNKLIAEEVAGDVLFVTERNENVWWYDGQRIAFRTAT